MNINRVILSRDVIWLNKFFNPEKTNTDETREVLMSEIPTQPNIVDNPIDQDENEKDDENPIEELEGENVDADQEDEYQIQTRSATRANVPREVKT